MSFEQFADAAQRDPYVKKLKAKIASRDPKFRDAWKRANESLVAKALTPGTVHIDHALANLSIQYKNGDYIGTQLMPVVKVNKLSGKYFIYDKRSRLAYPDDLLGARSSPNELNENITTANYSASSYGYKEYIDKLTLLNQDAPLDEMVDVIANLNEGIDFREELRIAALMTNAANYGGNTVTLAGSNLWTVSGGNPIVDIQNAVANLWSGRGASRVVGFCTLEVWNQMTRSAPILDLFKYTRPGLAQKGEISAVLGLDDILVTSARKDTANESQAAAYSRIWGNVFGVVRVATNPGLRNASFGITFRVGEKATDEWYDQTVGPMGGYYGRVSVTEDHRIVAPDTGFLITNPIG